MSDIDDATTFDLPTLVRRRFTETVTAPVLHGYVEADPTKLTPAAVLIPIVLRPEGATILLTRRTDHLHDHAGQVSFPGGRCEDEDASAHSTALREAEEEVGLRPDQIEIVGELARYSTGTGFVITPVVGFVSLPLELKLDAFEVAEVFEPPLAWLLDRRNFRRQSLEHRGRTREFWAAPWEGRNIWGATAGMLMMLSELIHPESR